MLQVIIDNKDGNMWDLPVSDLTFKTNRVGKAASVEFTFIDGGVYQDIVFQCNTGDVVRVTLDDKPVFYGYVFTVDSGRDEAVKVTAYDQVRYLMGSDTYVFKNTSATDIIKKIASDTGLKCGTLADTSYKIPRTVEDGSKLLDIIVNALSDTTRSTGHSYVFFDNFGELTLTDIKDWKIDLSIGDLSLAYDYKLSRSIDSDTYNRIKIVQDIKSDEKGQTSKVIGRNVYIEQDSETIAKWGRLQLYQKVDDKLNAAQVDEIKKTLLELKNRETRTFSLEAIGDIRVRAGCSVSINIADLSINNYFLVDECTHKFEGNDHKMTLELKVY
ncbi:hypothetical protein [Bacillus sp. 3255]|uniref:XkdQ/YqbQ family protein n=1 Tax=Bacillus sp. 3255 TaxID=2817904 RepID=UPI002857F47D|nr:hypothetical protein [Bacillus sp. 3255]MDR6883798.1 hypothetical protein [Bacillus sp. 3255]